MRAAPEMCTKFSEVWIQTPPPHYLQTTAAPVLFPLLRPLASRRLIIVVGVALLAGAGAAVAVWATSTGGSRAKAATTTPRLRGAPTLALDLPGTKVAGTIPAQLAAARSRLPAGDMRIAIARAYAAYDPAHREATIAALQKLPQSNPAVVFNLATLEAWDGHLSAAARLWQRASQLDPYGFYGGRADDILYPGQRPGYPFYVAPPGGPRGTAPALRSRLRADPHNAALWLALAVVLESTDREAAVHAAQHALQYDPEGVSPRVAAAVLSYRKANPNTTATTLAGLLQAVASGTNSQISFYLAEVAWWQKLDDMAIGSWRQVVANDPNGFYGKAAAGVLAQLNNPGSSS